MLRTITTAVFVSCICGILFGLGTAYSFLSVNAWQLENETKSYATLAEAGRTLAVNPNAKAQIEQTRHYFGIMDAKTVGAHDFFITNAGTADLILRVDRTSCSCLGIDVTPTRVPPGRTAKCTLRYTAEQAITGKFSQGGIVTTNDPDNREISLSVEGVFTNPVVVIPASVDFSRVPAGTERTRTVRFYGFENEPLQFSDATWANREHFDFHWEPAEFNESDEESGYLTLAVSVIEGTLTLKPGLPAGPFQEWFQLRTNYLSQANVNFTASGQIVVGGVSVSGQGYNRSTGTADLGRTISGSSLSREFSIQFSGASSQSMEVTVGAVDPTWIQTQLSPPTDVVGSRRVFSLTVMVPENAPVGSYSSSGDGQQAHVTLETNDASTPILRIPLQFSVGRQ